MHILFLPSYYPSNVNPIAGIFIREQALALSRSGIQVGVAAPIIRSLKRKGLNLEEVGAVNQIGLDHNVPTCRRYVWNWLPRIPYGSLSIWMNAGKSVLEQYMDQYGHPDVIHVHVTEYAGPLALRIKNRYGIPYVITEHSTAYALGSIPKWHLPLIRKAYGSASARIVVSPGLGKTLENTLGEDAIPWIWIPNILPTDFQKIRLKQNHNDCFRFLNIGMMEEKKGQIYLLQAFSKFFKGDSSVQLRIGGDGPRRPSLERLALDLGIKDQVIFLGMLGREEVVSEMQDCDVFVLPSIYETFGVVLIEALACGKPVVATVSGGPEYFIDSELGLLTPPQDVTSLGKAMRQIRSHINEYNPEKIQGKCLAKFGEKTVISHLINLYQQI